MRTGKLTYYHSNKETKGDSAEIPLIETKEVWIDGEMDREL